MAEAKEAQVSDNSAHWRAFGLHEEPPVEHEPGDDAQAQDEESQDGEGESEGGDADASQAADAGEALEDLKADKGDKGEESLSEEGQDEADKSEKKYATIAAVKRDLDAEKKKREAAEKQMRDFQGDKDRLQHQVNMLQGQFMAELNRLKAAQNPNTNEGELPDIDDEAVVDGKTLKNLLKKSREKREVEQGAESEKSAKQQWVNIQPDITDIRKFIGENKFGSDPDILGIPTDTVGFVWVARAKMLEKKLADADTKLKQEVEKARADERKKFGNRKPIPPTGGNGSAPGGSNSSAINDVEKRFLKFFGKDAKIVQRG